MERARIKLIDVFTSKPFTGSPAYVLTEADRLDDQTMQRIARELNFKAVFVQKSTDEKAQYRLRFFTTQGEIGFAAHCMIAALHALSEEAKFFLSEPVTKIMVQTSSGVLSTEILCQGGQDQKITLEFPRADFGEEPNPDEIAQALKINADELAHAPPQVVDVGSAHLMVQLKNIDAVKNLKPDLLALAGLNTELGAVSTHVYCMDALSPLAMVHTRTFAPAIGASELVASGTVSGALGAYLVSREIIRGNSPITFIAEQGHSVGRPCEITVVVYFKRTSVDSLGVSGEAATVMEGEIIP